MEAKKDIHLTIRISKDLGDHLREVCKNRGSNSSKLIRDILLRFLKENDEGIQKIQITDRLSAIEHQNIQHLKLLVSQLSMLISLIQRVSKTDPNEAQKIFKQAAIEATQPERIIQKFNDLAKK